ncbi:MAG: DUF2493 domain-containing protein [Pseudomonadota bacterium]
MRVLVCGGGKFEDRSFLFRELDTIHQQQKITLIVNGGAPGADRLSTLWAEARGVPLQVYKEDAPDAGIEEYIALNAVMLSETSPELIVAFSGGVVTADMVQRGREAGITIKVL